MAPDFRRTAHHATRRPMTESSAPGCMSCGGSGEYPTDFGPADCPDCGGAGFLPAYSVLVEWRARDIERAHANRDGTVAAEILWLLTELRRARGALTQIVALAHDVNDEDAIAQRIRYAANSALGLYRMVPVAGPAGLTPDPAPQGSRRPESGTPIDRRA